MFIPNQTSGVEVDDNCIQSYIKLQLQHSSQFIIYRLSDDKKRIIVDKIGPVGKWGKRLWIIRATVIKICNMNTWVLCCKTLRLFFFLFFIVLIGCTYDNFVSELQNAGSKGEGRYGVFDFNYTVKERIVNKIVFFLW